jgi:hypothetical protein
MKWFFNWLYIGIKEVEEHNREKQEAIYMAPDISRKNHPFSNLKSSLSKGSTNDVNQVQLNQSAMNFRLYPATGGHIVEYSYFNEDTDRQSQALHLIPSDADLGESISKIMTLEALKR